MRYSGEQRKVSSYVSAAQYVKVGAAAWLRLNRRLSAWGWVSGAIEEISTRLGPDGRLNYMKEIGFLSFDYWTPSPQSGPRSSADALLQSSDLAVEAKRLGMNGAFFRVHHFAQPLALPFPLARSGRR